MANMLPLLALGVGAVLLIKKKKDEKADGPIIGEGTATPTPPPQDLKEFKCYEGQMEGDFVDQNGVNWHWVILKVYDLNLVVYVEEGWGQGGGSKRHDVGQFDISTPHLTLCQALAEFFKQRGLSR